MSSLTPRTKERGFWYSVVYTLVLALLLNFVLEALSRHSALRTFTYLYHRPLAYFYNTLILACFLSLALPFRRRRFVRVLITVIWLILGIINCVMRFMRITPLGCYDFVIFVRNFSIASIYISLWEMVLIALGAVAVVAGLMLVFRHAPRSVPQRKWAFLFMLLLWGATALCTLPYAAANRDYADPSKAYKRFGFPYSLLRSAVDRGVSRPEVYTKDSIADILNDVEEAAPEATVQRTPNFIFLQLESFLAADNFLSVTCSQDPTPTFTALREECATGFLRVPMIGGGTANVEFEVVTGMSLGDFGTGEYPYSTVLTDATCESFAYDLKDLGYAAHAIHSNTATFYRRHQVFPRLGFDTFTSLEYMQDYTVNSLGWCRDECLVEPILDALRAEEAPDVIFAVSVQGHGMYTTDAPEEPYAITTAGLEENPGLKNAFEYYASQLRETDDFLHELLEELQAYPEPVVLVIYGDHLPALDFEEEQFKSGSLLATEYVIWTNDDSFPPVRRDVTAYQLSAYVFGQYGISNGLLMRFHQQYADSENYLSALHDLEYDMLYGDKYLYDGESPHVPTEMRMGILPIVAERAVFDGRAMIVTGENFTRASAVYVNDHALDTVYVDGSTLVGLTGLLDRVEAGALVSVAQVASDGTLLSRTEDVVSEGR